jgi:hypothetical protein
VPASNVYTKTSLSWAELFTLDSYAKDSQHDTDFDPYILTDEGTFTG